MSEPPATDEGWYVVHDLRRIDWGAWSDAPERVRERAIEEGREYLSDAEAVADAEEGDSAVFSVLGHEADVMTIHLRPTLGDLDALERRFEHTALSRFTERTASYLSITEASGYTAAQDYFDPDAEADPGIRRYIEARLYPEIPGAEFVSFYPMDKRRGPDHNWYDLPFEERAEHMSAHGEIGRKYGGRVTQIVSGSIGLDDYEWGVTLFANDPIAVKDLLYEMRFDPSSARFAEFGPFYAGRRFPPADLAAFLAGDPIPTEPIDGEGDVDDGLRAEIEALGADLPREGHAVLVRSTTDVEAMREEVDGLRGNFDHYDSHLGTTVHELDDGSAVVSTWETASAADTASGFLEELDGATETDVGAIGEGVDDGSSAGDAGAGDESAAPRGAGGNGVHGSASESARDIREELAERGIDAGRPHGEDVYAMVLYSEADPEAVAAAVEDLADGFDRYDTHVKTALYEAEGAHPAVVSIWETEDAASTAAEYLDDLPGIVREPDREGSFGTMGMFYTVVPDYRAEFVEKFAEVADLLEEMEGHVESTLYANREDENDMFIASRWESKEACMDFFRSDAFHETVEWGRDVLADRPRHVFLA